MFHFMICIIFLIPAMAVLSCSVFFLFDVLCHAKFTVSIAVVGAVSCLCEFSKRTR